MKRGDGRWELEEGRWELEDGSWELEDGRGENKFYKKNHLLSIFL